MNHLTPRQQAWVILSDLFVDTEPDDAGLRHMGQELRALGLDPATAHHILNHEVAPVFGVNLLSVAGNWTGWRPADVVAAVSEWLQKRDAPGLRGLWHRSWLATTLRLGLLARPVQPHWRRVAQAMLEV
jgi:hypothetical protein